MSLTKVTWSMTETGVSCIEDFGASPSASASENAIAIAAALTAAAASKNILTTRSIGVFEVTGTFIIPAGVQFVGRTYGDKPTLRWSGATAPTNLSTMSAFVLAGNQSALVGWNVNMETSGDFRRTVSMGGFDNQVCSRNKIILNLTGVDTSQAHYTIFCSSGSLFYYNQINANEITGYVNTAVDGIQMSYSVNAKVMDNYVHDLTKGSGAGPVAGDRYYWGIYCSQRCYGLLLSGNIIQSTNMSGIHVSNAVDGVANDYGRRVTDNYIRSVTWVGLSLEELNGATVSGTVVDTSGYPVGIVGSQNLSFTNAAIKNFVNTVPLVSSTKPLMEIVPTSKNVSISNIAFGAGGDALICLFINSSNISISNVTAAAAAPPAIIQSNSASSNITIDNVVAETPTSTAAATRIFVGKDNSIVSNCYLPCSATGQIGIRLVGDRNIASNNRLSGGTSGIWLTSASTNSIAMGNIVSGASGTFILDDGIGNSVVNNIVV